MKIKFLAALAAIFTLTMVTPAFAAYTPVLTWERGLQQTITLGGSTESVLWNLELVGPKGDRYNFSRSGKNEAGYLIYAIDLSNEISLGRYEIYTSALEEDRTLVSYVDVVPLTSYDIKSDPEKLGKIAMAAFLIFSLIATTRREDFENRSRPHQSNDEEESNSQATVDFKDNLEDNVLRGPVDRIGFGRLHLVRRMDARRFSLTYHLSQYSPLLSRFTSDGSWFQSIFGPLVLALPVTGFFLGIQLGLDTDMSKSLVPTNLTLITIALILGIVDAASGAIAALTYGIFALATQNLVNAIDLRVVIGVSLLFFAPVLLAGTIRPIRRDLKSWSAIERLADLVIAMVFSAIGTQGLVMALDGLSQQKTLLSTYSFHLSVIAGATVAARFMAEDLASRMAPARLNYLIPTKRIEQETSYFVGSLLIKVGAFSLFMIGFFGLSWQAMLALAMLLIPQVLKVTSKNFPNFPILYQILPSGLPQIVVMGFVGTMLAAWVNGLPLISQDRSKTIVLLLAIPGFLLSILKSFGREPAEGDAKWYCRPRARAFYLIGGLFMLVIAIAQQIGVTS